MLGVTSFHSGIIHGKSPVDTDVDDVLLPRLGSSSCT